MINLNIDLEFQSQIPPLTDDEFKQLEENIPVSYTHLDVYKRQVQDGESQFCNSGAVFIKCPATLTEQFQIVLILLFTDEFPAVGSGPDSSSVDNGGKVIVCLYYYS